MRAMDRDPRPGERLDPDVLSWTALLGRWMDFARASTARNDDGRWAEAAASVIDLQAVTFALGELDRVPAGEQGVAVDRAALVVERARERLGAIWPPGDERPATIDALIADAQEALSVAEAAANERVIELRWPGPGPLEVPDVLDPEDLAAANRDGVDGDRGRPTLLLMQPGTIAMPGEPVAWWRAHRGLRIAGCGPRPVAGPRQVYRQFDDDGRITGDVIAPLDDRLLPGMPLLVPILVEGERVGRFTLDARRWAERQRAAMDGSLVEVRVEAGGGAGHGAAAGDGP